MWQVLFACVYGKKLTIFPCQGNASFSTRKMCSCVRPSRKTWQVYEKYFYGLGNKRRPWRWDKCLITTFRAHEQLQTCQGKLDIVKENVLVCARLNLATIVLYTNAGLPRITSAHLYPQYIHSLIDLYRSSIHAQ
jgi:hypothetical protein